MPHQCLVWLRRLAARAHATLVAWRRIDWRDERGDIEQRAVAIALMVGLTIAVVAIIRAVVLEWANIIVGP